MKKTDIIFRTPWNSNNRNPKKLWLDKNENNDTFLKNIHSNVLKKVKLLDISAYPDLSETYRNLSKFLKVNINKIFLTAGSDIAIKSVFEAFVSPGNKVLTTNPTYAMYSVYCKIFKAKNISINYEYTKKSPYLDIKKFIF